MRKVYVGMLTFVLCLWAISAMALPKGSMALLGFGAIKEVAFSPDNKVLAIASDYGIYLYNSVTFAQIRYFFVEGGNSISFSPDGKLLASGSDDNTIKIWDISNGKEVKTLVGHKWHIISVTFSSDGKLLASGSSDNTIKLWDVLSGKEVKTFKGHTSDVTSISFIPGSKLLASGSDDETIKLWDVSSGDVVKTLVGHANWVKSISISPDGKLIASGSCDNTIKLWDISSGKEVKTFVGHIDWVNSVCFSPDGKLIVSGSSDETVKLWDISSGKEVKTLEHTSSIYSVCFSPDGKLLASGGEDKTVRIWDISSGKEVKTLVGHTSGVYSVSFSPDIDGKLLASGSSDGTIKLWDVLSGKEVKTLIGHVSWVISVCFSPDGKLLASGSYDNTIKLWDISSGKEIKTFRGHTDYITTISFSPDVKLIASGDRGNDTVRLWDVSSGNEVKALKHALGICSVCFSPDGKLLASGSNDDTIRLWDISSGEVIKTFEGGRVVLFSPDGKLLASGNGGVKFYDVSSGEVIKTFVAHKREVVSLSFSPDGKLLASGSLDGTILLWDMSPYFIYDIVIDVNPTDGGSVTLNPAGGSYRKGKQVTLIATPSTDYRFDKWSGDLTGNDNPITIIIDKNKSITAHFVGARTLGITSVETLPNTKVNVHLNISDAKDMASGDILIEYDPKVLTIGEVKGTALLSDMLLAVNKDELGKIRLAMAGTKGLPSGSGALVDIELIITNVQPGTQTTLKISSAKIYSELGASIPISLGDGIITIKFLGIKGDVNNDGVVKSNDAMLALRISAGLMVPDEYQKWAADMNGDGVVRSNDAMLILRKAAGLSAPNRDIIASSDRIININLSEAYGVSGESITVPIIVDNIDILSSGDISISYDSSVLRVVGVSSEQSMLLESNINNSGIVRISFAGTDKLVGNEIAKVKFDVISDKVSQLSIKTAELYNRDAIKIMTKVRDGKFTSFLSVPDKSALLQNYPNPFNPDTWIPYQLKDGSEVKICIYDVTGTLVRRLDLGYKPAGIYTSQDRSAYWDGRNELGEQVSSGIYFYTIQAGKYRATGKMLMLK